MNIVTTTGTIAFTPVNLPGLGKNETATSEQMRSHAKTMNKRAEALGIETRYEVK